MSNALASRYTDPSNIPSNALTNVPTPSRIKSRRRKFKDVDLLEPCIVRHVPLGEVFMSLRDKCESIMNMPTDNKNFTPELRGIPEDNETDLQPNADHSIYVRQKPSVEIVHISTNPDETREPDTNQQFSLIYTIKINTGNPDTKDHSFEATVKYASTSNPEIKMPETSIKPKPKNAVFSPDENINKDCCIPVPQNGTEVEFQIIINDYEEKKEIVPDKFCVAWKLKGHKKIYSKEMQNSADNFVDIPSGFPGSHSDKTPNDPITVHEINSASDHDNDTDEQDFLIDQNMESVILQCQYKKLSYTFQFELGTCVMRDEVPILSTSETQHTLSLEYIEKEIEALSHVSFTAGDIRI